MRFGASIWPWKWDAPYDETIQRIGRAGFRATELIAWDQRALDEYYTEETVRDLVSVLGDEGMTLSQFVVSTRGAASADATTRQHAVDLFKRGVDVGVQLGATLINTVTHVPFDLPTPRITDRPVVQRFTMPTPAGLDWDQNWHDYVDVLRACADYAQNAGVVYTLEPHPYCYGATTDGLLRILDAVGSTALGVNFDPSHMYPLGDFPNVTVQRLGARLKHCHFSDNDGETNVHWRPGMGKIDWPLAMAALAEIGYDGVVSLEFEDIPGVARAAWDSHGQEPQEVASAGFEDEYKVALEYLTGLAVAAGLTVEAGSATGA